MLKKLRLRFVAINMVIVTAMLLIIFGLVFHFTRVDLDNQSDLMLQKLAQSAKDPVGKYPDIPLPFFILEINTWGDIRIVGNTKHDLTDTAFVQDVIQQVLTSRQRSGLLTEYSLKYTSESGLGVEKIVFLDISSHNQTLTSLLHISLITGALSFIAFMLISILLARWAVKPIDIAWQQQKQFISDASHELKTPLSVIISNAELMNESNSGEQAHLPENILSSARQMRKLVEGLLELARADNGQIRTHFETVDLSQTVSCSILPFEPLFYEKQLMLKSTVEPGILITGSQLHLTQLTDILLDNAGKYSAPGVVELRLQRQGRNQCLLSVSNPGNPIPKSELKKIFQRFYRVDTARAESGSFGLGLSIAQRIVSDHQGHIWAESNETGSRFSVLLPCFPAQQ